MIEQEAQVITTCKYVMDLISQEGTSEQKLLRVIYFCEQVVINLNKQKQTQWKKVI